jgi:hypothetical protein
LPLIGHNLLTYVYNCMKDRVQKKFVASGISRGCGWQHLGAYVNLGAFYLIGVPVALVLGFTMHLGGAGFWMGMIAGGATQVTLLSVITAMTNWEKMVGSLILFFYLMLLLHKDLIAIDDAFLPVFFFEECFPSSVNLSSLGDEKKYMVR